MIAFKSSGEPASRAILQLSGASTPTRADRRADEVVIHIQGDFSQGHRADCRAPGVEFDACLTGSRVRKEPLFPGNSSKWRVGEREFDFLKWDRVHLNHQCVCARVEPAIPVRDVRFVPREPASRAAIGEIAIGKTGGCNNAEHKDGECCGGNTMTGVHGPPPGESHNYMVNSGATSIGRCIFIVSLPGEAGYNSRP